MLVHMHPGDAAQDAGYGGGTDPELIGKIPLARSPCDIEPTNAADLRSLQNHARPDRSSLCVHVSNVIGISAKEQMVRSHARRVIALVADEQSRRDCASGQFPREPMRSDLFVADPQSAIPMIPDVSVVPAAPSLIDASPEPLLNRSLPSRIGTRSATEAPRAPRDGGRLGLEWLAAVQTGYGDAGSFHGSDIAWEVSHS